MINYYEAQTIHGLWLGPSLLYVLKILPIMLLSSVHCSKKLPIMLNIMPITIAIMPQFMYNFNLLFLITTYTLE